MTTHEQDNVPQRLLDVNEVAQLFGVSRKTVYEMTWRGDLEAVRVGQRLRYQPETLNKYLRDRRVEPK